MRCLQSLLAAIVILPTGAGATVVERTEPNSIPWSSTRDILMIGPVNFVRSGSSAAIYVQSVLNKRSLGSMSGTMSLQVWATSSEYLGTTLFGHKLAEVELGVVSGGDSWHGINPTTRLFEPPPGVYNLVIVLAEGSVLPQHSGAYHLVTDWQNLGFARFESAPSLLRGSAFDPQLVVSGKSSLSTRAVSFTLRGTASEAQNLSRIEYRMDPPGKKSWTDWRGVSLVGTVWTQKIRLPRSGLYRIELRAVDPNGATSRHLPVSITRR